MECRPPFARLLLVLRWGGGLCDAFLVLPSPGDASYLLESKHDDDLEAEVTALKVRLCSQHHAQHPHMLGPVPCVFTMLCVCLFTAPCVAWLAAGGKSGAS